MSRPRPRPGVAPSLPPVIGRCIPCGTKMTYRSRKDARRAAKAAFPHERLAAYPCPHSPGQWHFGHLAEPVRQGLADRRELYRKELP